MSGDCGRNFRQGADPGLHKSAEPRAMPVSQVMRDNDFDGLPNCLRGRVAEQVFGFSAPRADLAGRIYSQGGMHDAHRSPGHHADAGSSAEIFVGRKTIKWLRLYGRP